MGRDPLELARRFSQTCCARSRHSGQASPAGSSTNLPSNRLLPYGSNALKPIHDLLTASLCDAEPLPRYTALVEVGRLWVWIPGRSLTPFEEQTLGEWKGAIHVPVVRCLAARDPETRMAAVACLGALPIDSAAVSAVAYVDDPIADVRKQTLSSFSQRNLLLTDEMLFKRLHDDDPTDPRDGEPDLEDQRTVSGTDQSGRLDLQPATRTARLGDPSIEEPNRRRSRHLADPAFARSGRDGSDELDRGAGEAQGADRSTPSGRDGALGRLAGRSPGGQQGGPVGGRGNDSRAAPPARLVKPQSQGELIPDEAGREIAAKTSPSN